MRNMAVRAPAEPRKFTQVVDSASSRLEQDAWESGADVQLSRPPTRLPSFCEFLETVRRPEETCRHPSPDPITQNWLPISRCVPPTILAADTSSAALLLTLDVRRSSKTPDGNGSDKSEDSFPKQTRERALLARDIVHHHFGRYSAQELLAVKAKIDPNRPLFGSDLPSGRKGPQSTKQHCVSERDRRSDHQVMMQLQGKRVPDEIFQLAGYRTGALKAPGKNPLHVAMLMMIEFDALVEAKLLSEISQLQRQIQQNNHFIYNGSKRKRDDEGATSAFGGDLPLSPAASNSSSRRCLTPRTRSPL